MFYVGSMLHLVIELIILSIILFFVVKKQFVLKYYKVILVLWMAVSLSLEIEVYIKALMEGNVLRIIPLGTCHLSVYITTILVFKYNKQAHIISFMIIGGSYISLLSLAPIDGISLLRVRPYYFIIIHLYIIVLNIMLAYKHNLTISKKEYLKSIVIMLLIVTLYISLTPITGDDEMFFFGGPEGTPIDGVKFGWFRAVGAYIVYFLLFSMPYFVMQLHRRIKGRAD